VPAAAVIPAPIVYIKAVAVKKLVVGTWVRLSRAPEDSRPSVTEQSATLGSYCLPYCPCQSQIWQDPNSCLVLLLVFGSGEGQG